MKHPELFKAEIIEAKDAMETLASEAGEAVKGLPSEEEIMSKRMRLKYFAECMDVFKKVADFIKEAEELKNQQKQLHKGEKDVTPDSGLELEGEVITEELDTDEI